MGNFNEIMDQGPPAPIFGDANATMQSSQSQHNYKDKGEGNVMTL